MPWSNQNGGGGPWGGGGGNNQGPWGQGPNRPRGSGGPPDLEEIIRRGQDQLKNVVPGGFNGGIFVIAALLIGVFWLMNSIYTVQPDERGWNCASASRRRRSPCPACTSISGRLKRSRW